jgi:hypothetical protein
MHGSRRERAEGLPSNGRIGRQLRHRRRIVPGHIMRSITHRKNTCNTLVYHGSIYRSNPGAAIGLRGSAR